jgi:hypothetical protein
MRTVRTSIFLRDLAKASSQTQLHNALVRLGDASGTDRERRRYGWGTPPAEAVVMQETSGDPLGGRMTDARRDALSAAPEGHVSEMAKADFDAAEATIAGERRAFLEVGEALLAIQRGAGHRHLGFSRFEDYVCARWHLGRTPRSKRLE